MSQTCAEETGRRSASSQDVSARLASYRRRITSPLPSSAGLTVSTNTFSAVSSRAAGRSAQEPSSVVSGTFRSYASRTTGLERKGPSHPQKA